tara:strand:+ start:537 stop:725 length:189 start_codon:yes stop_codon:yes gene_type:complete
MMKVVNRTVRGKNIKVVYDSPCDPCERKIKCLGEKISCKAFNFYVNNGYYKLESVGKALKTL